MFIPKYSCGNGADGNLLPACNKVASGQPCCTKASNMGWRYLLLTTGGIGLTVFVLRFGAFRFQESPKFLLSRGQDKKVVEVLHNIARFNNRESMVTLEMFAALTNEDSSTGSSETSFLVEGLGAKKATSSFGRKVKIELARYKVLFSTAAMARLTILIWITYIFDYWGFSIAGEISLWVVFTSLLIPIGSRVIIAQDLARKEQLHPYFIERILPKLHHHLLVWHSRCSFGGFDVRGTHCRPQMGHGRIFRHDGYFAVLFRRC